MEYCSPMRKENILPFVTTQIDSEHMLNEVNQTEKDKHYVSLICGSKKVKSVKKKKKRVNNYQEMGEEGIRVMVFKGINLL